MAIDSDRLVRLLLMHRGMLLGYAQSILIDWHLAEDVFQEAAVIILKKGALLQKENEFPVWSRQVVRLEALVALRKKNKAPELMEPLLLDAIEKDWGEESERDGYLPALRTCLEQLTPKARRLIELRYVAGLAGNVLAARLNQQPNTVYVALSRIYRILHECIKNRLASEGQSHD